MVMNSAPANNPDPKPNSTELKFKGVRKRKWGKWVSEIRLPHSRDRIWLGSYDSPIKAARAFDAAQLCLRGPSAANLNFPDNPPRIDGATQGLTPAEIQVVATTFANAEVHQHLPPVEVPSTPSVEEEASTPSVEEEASTPSVSISDGGVQCESGDESLAFDGGPGPVLDYWDFNTLEILRSGNFDATFGLGDFYTSQLSDYNEYDNWNGSGCEDLFLWNF